MTTDISEKEILTTLLDKYYRSGLSTGQNKVNIKISIKVNQDSFPDYVHVDDVEKHDQIEQVFLKLESKQFVFLERDKRNSNEIKSLALNADNISHILIYCKYESPIKIAENYQKQFESYANSNSQTVKSFSEAMLTILVNHRNLKSVEKFFDKDPIKLKEIVKSIENIDALKGEERERDFSERVLSDSKKFAAIRSNVDRIYREFSPECYSELDSPSEQLGVIHNPTYVILKGNAIIRIHNQTINLKDFGDSFVLYDSLIQDLQIVNIGGHKIITVENLTTYYDFNDSDALIVYLAGFHNQIKSLLLKKIYALYPGLEYLHWSDIDSGGFYIFNHLKKETGIPFLPFRMSTEYLKEKKAYTKPLTENDKSRLENQLNSPEFDYFNDTIKFMLDNNCKLEQESFDI